MANKLFFLELSNSRNLVCVGPCVGVRANGKMAQKWPKNDNISKWV